MRSVARAIHSDLERPDSQAVFAVWRAAWSVGAACRRSVSVRYAFREDRAKEDVGSLDIDLAGWKPWIEYGVHTEKRV